MQTGDDILFTAPGPDFGTIPTATTEIVGTPGNGFNVYWIVTHFPIGSVVSGPFPQKDSPNVLDDENYIHISWLPAPGASSYDLLVTKDLVLPRQLGQVWLAGGLTETEFRDTGQGLAFYDVAGIRFGAPQEEHVYFNNRDFSQPTLQFIPWPIQVSSIIFPDGSEQTSAGGGGGGSQTPWLSDIDANQFVLFNIGQILGNAFGTFFVTARETLFLGTDNNNSALTIFDFGLIDLAFPASIGGRLDVTGDINIVDDSGAGFTYRINGVPFGGVAGNPAGANLSVQFNNNGIFGGNENLIWNPSLGLSGSLQVINPFSSGSPTIANLNSGGLQFNMPSSFFLTNLTTTGTWGITAGGEISIDTGGNNPLLLNASSNGNVGIGTTNPAFKLDVQGDINIIDPVPYGGSGVGFRLNGALFAETIYPGRVRLNNTQFIFGTVGSINLGADSSSDTVQMSIFQNEITCYVGIAVAPYLNVAPVDPNSDSVFFAADSGIICSRPLSFLNLPTSAAGLSPGDVWNNGGVLNIV